MVLTLSIDDEKARIVAWSTSKVSDFNGIFVRKRTLLAVGLLVKFCQLTNYNSGTTLEPLKKTGSMRTQIAFNDQKEYS